MCVIVPVSRREKASAGIESTRPPCDGDFRRAGRRAFRIANFLNILEFVVLQGGARKCLGSYEGNRAGIAGRRLRELGKPSPHEWSPPASAARSAFAIASAILFMPSARVDS